MVSYRAEEGSQVSATMYNDLADAYDLVVDAIDAMAQADDHEIHGLLDDVLVKLHAHWWGLAQRGHRDGG